MTTRRLMIIIGVLALALAACGGSSTSGGDSSDTPSDTVVAGDPQAGAVVYSGNCAACHAPDLSGIDGLGRPLAPSDFVTPMSEDDLAAFIIAGRDVDDPENTSGVAMPPRGGNPSLTDQDIQDVAAYLQAQQ